jgi:hypothetical protein
MANTEKKKPYGLVDNNFVKLAGDFCVLLFKEHHVVEVNWKPASKVHIVVSKEEWYQPR